VGNGQPIGRAVPCACASAGCDPSKGGSPSPARCAPCGCCMTAATLPIPSATAPRPPLAPEAAACCGGAGPDQGASSRTWGGACSLTGEEVGAWVSGRNFLGATAGGLVQYARLDARQVTGVYILDRPGQPAGAASAAATGGEAARGGGEAPITAQQTERAIAHRRRRSRVGRMVPCAGGGGGRA
jgi:hypothetical protein